ncbi:MAG TPA: hypothetical protein VJ623_11215 [Holophagaceae bacterium]|nr:hypothetical protein [Holophagaceae bacterium]
MSDGLEQKSSPTKGFVALIDVLGFTNLVNRDSGGERIERYLSCLEQATKNCNVDSVVFSDSIILSVGGSGPEPLSRLVRACSHLMWDLLIEGIPLKGAIAAGSFIRRESSGSVFIAGKAIIEAYHYEQIQNWIGIVLAPSVIEQVPEIKSLCSMRDLPNDFSKLGEFFAESEWSARVQRFQTIPFKEESSDLSASYDGLAVIPIGRYGNFGEIANAIQRAIERLEWLRMIAPSPAAQRKYDKPIALLNGLTYYWLRVARWAQEIKD